MQKDLVEKIALFYYFCFLDESKAQLYAIRTIKKILKTDALAKNQKINFADLVKATDDELKKSFRKLKPINLAFSADYIQLPKNSNWGPWFEFRRKATENESRMLIYAKILNISEEEIAQGLSLPKGTVRYRISNGLKILGSITTGERA